jgi:uncharacterized protein
MTTPNILLIFIKNPIKGKVKTRLAATLGDSTALLIYEKLCAYTREIVLPIYGKKMVFYSDFIEYDDEWKTADFDKRIQRGDNLGEKMKNAFAEVLRTNSKAIIIGSDCATLNENIINDAFQLLEDQDIVIGPAKDGGYYLLGMKQLYPSLFENIAWSSDTVFASTLAEVKKLNLTYGILPTLSDIDTEQDWQAYLKSLTGCSDLRGF